MSIIVMTDLLQAIGKHLKGDITDLQIERSKTCLSCNKLEQKKYAEFLNSKIIEINGYVCGLCECPIATKIFAKDKKNICDKWNQ